MSCCTSHSGTDELFVDASTCHFGDDATAGISVSSVCNSVEDNDDLLMIITLKLQIAQCRSEADMHYHSIQKSSKEIQKMKVQLNEITLNRNYLSRNMKENEDSLNEMEMTNTHKTNEIQHLLEINKELEHEIEDLVARKEVNTLNIREIKNQVNKNESKRNAVCAQGKSLTSQLTSKKEENTKLKDMCYSLISKNADLSVKLDLVSYRPVIADISEKNGYRSKSRRGSKLMDRRKKSRNGSKLLDKSI